MFFNYFIITLAVFAPLFNAYPFIDPKDKGICYNQGPVYACGFNLGTKNPRLEVVYKSTGVLWNPQDTEPITDLNAWYSINGKAATAGPFKRNYGIALPLDNSTLTIPQTDTSKSWSVQLAFFRLDGSWDSIYGKNYRFDFKKSDQLSKYPYLKK
ncbi:hypothetical protein HDV02_003964 [Globomyces sp. JEL0801]|nr:hypothetical protein HDV02_003964 [Globomyces sp. JEL0801]